MRNLPPGARAHVDRLQAAATDDLRCSVARVRAQLATRDQADVTLSLVEEVGSGQPEFMFGMLVAALLELANMPPQHSSPSLPDIEVEGGG